MASSRPFQSQILTRAVKIYHRLMATGTQWLRQGRATALLWTQIALYPPYVALQAMRVAVRKTRAVAANWRDRLKLTPHAARRLGTAATLGSDWGLQQLMTAVVPVTTATTQDLQTPAIAGLTRWGGAIGVLSVHSEPVPAEMAIQGLASCLQTRALVLVDHHNRVCDRLSTEQQHGITAAITDLMATYYHWRRQQQQLSRLQTGSLPLPQVSPRAWWPVRVMVWLLAWMQTGTVASTINWFQEAEVTSLPGPMPSVEKPLFIAPTPRSLPPQFPLRPVALPMQQVLDSWLLPQCRQALQRMQPLLTATGQRVRPALIAARSYLALPPAPPSWNWLSSWRNGAGQPGSLPGLPSLSSVVSLQLRSAQQWLLDPAMFSLTLAAVESEALPPGPPTIKPLPLMRAPAGISLQPVWAEGSAEAGAGDWINVEVSAVEYLDRPLMWILRRLDTVLVGLETFWQRLWQWLRSQF